jgi:hypothetical protein
VTALSFPLPCLSSVCEGSSGKTVLQTWMEETCCRLIQSTPTPRRKTRQRTHLSDICHLISGDLTAHPRHMSHLPMYARYGRECMTEEDVTSFDLDGNTFERYRYEHFTFTRALHRQIVDIVSPRSFYQYRDGST